MQTTTQVRALARWLRDHHDVVSAQQLRALGFSRDYPRTQLDARRWQAVHRGVYCTYTGPLSFESRCAAALAACGPDAALAGASALQIHGMTGHTADVVQVVVPHDLAAPRLSGVAITRSRTLTERSVLVRRGMRVVTAERALLDHARSHPTRARHVLTAAVQRGFTTPVRLRATIFATGNIAGRGRLLAITHTIEGGDRSTLERRFIRLVTRAGLPRPLQNHPLVVETRRLWLDVCYPDLRVAIEIDGRTYHLLSEDWERDLERQDLVVLDGWLVLRFTAHAIQHEPDAVVAQVRRAIEARTADRVGLAG